MKARQTVLEPLAIAAFAMALLASCTTQPTLPSTPAPLASSFDPAIVAKGAQLAAIGNCAVCHTADSGEAYAGGRPLETPFGTIYATNITPDRDTGIGRWTEAAFRRAMREGLDREGRNLYPAFPYDHFTKLTDEDIRSIYVFLMTRKPVHAQTPPNRLPFPLNQRGLISVWKALFFEPGVFRPDPERSAQWNRGAYLAEGLGHCGACHTPRNLAGAEKKDQAYSGGEAEGWHAPALNEASPSPTPWSVPQLIDYLRTGLAAQHAIAAGPMKPVVENLGSIADEDVSAIAMYIASVYGSAGPHRRAKAQAALAQARQARAAYPFAEHAAQEAPEASGAAIYAGACAACHDQGRRPGSGSALHLALGTATTEPTSANLVHIIMEGITPHPGSRGRDMPAFAGALDDRQMADLVNYVRARFGHAPPWNDVEAQIRKGRKSIATQNEASR